MRPPRERTAPPPHASGGGFGSRAPETPIATSSGTLTRRLFDRLPYTRSFLGRQAAINLAANAVVLLIGLGTGTVLARALATTGRGQLSAVIVAPSLLAVAAELGCTQAITYEQARDASASSWIVPTWLLMLTPSILLTTVIGGVIVHFTLGPQGAAVQWLGEAFMTGIVFMAIADVATSVIIGDHHFRTFNLLRIGQPASALVSYLVLWAAHALTVGSAVATLYATQAATAAGAILIVWRLYGWGHLDLRKGLRSLWFGVKAHGSNVSQLANGRLDQLMLPAFVTASSLGLYAVAVSVSGIVYYIAAPLAVLVLPAAARRKRDSPEIVRRVTQAALAVAALVALALALMAPFAITRVYGPGFLGSAPLTWLLLPGTALYVAGYTLWQGLYALGRPLQAAAAQALGVALTVTGLAVWLPRGGGVQAAAIVSSAAYGGVAICSLCLYCRAASVSMRTFLQLRAGRLSGSDP